MSLSDTTENVALKMFLQGSDPSYRSGATQYLSLYTADPGEAASLTNEANYTGYARVPLTKATAWTDGGSSFQNAALLQFGPCTVGTNVITHFAVVDTGPATGTAVNMMISGALSSSLTVSPGIQPQFQANSLTISCD